MYYRKKTLGMVIDIIVWTAIFLGLVYFLGYAHLSGVMRVTPW
jgi:hypothetical protein